MKQSKLLQGLSWTGPRIQYAAGPFKGDTFPVTWADDDILYSAAGDTVSEKKKDGLSIVSFVGGPTDYKINVVNPMPHFLGYGGNGLKPTGMLSRKGVLYLFAHNLGRNADMELGHGYDAQIFMSKDKGRTWLPDIREIEHTPMFPGRDFGSPAFVNYGRDHIGSDNNFIYAVSGEGWANGNRIKVGRAPAEDLLSSEAWEFVAGFDPNGDPVWTHDCTLACTVLEDPGFLGCPEVVYLVKLKRYLFLGWHFKKQLPDKYSPDDGSELALYEAPQPWGPFSLISRLDWELPEVTPYNPRVPLKWFDQETLRGWLLFSGSWRNGGSSEFYRAHVRPFQLESSGSV